MAEKSDLDSRCKQTQQSMFNLLFRPEKCVCIHTNANPIMQIQREALILGNNMSSGAIVPIFGKRFAKMRQ